MPKELANGKPTTRRYSSEETPTAAVFAGIVVILAGLVLTMLGRRAGTRRES